MILVDLVSVLGVHFEIRRYEGVLTTRHPHALVDGGLDAVKIVLFVCRWREA